MISLSLYLCLSVSLSVRCINLMEGDHKELSSHTNSQSKCPKWMICLSVCLSPSLSLYLSLLSLSLSLFLSLSHSICPRFRICHSLHIPFSLPFYAVDDAPGYVIGHFISQKNSTKDLRLIGKWNTFFSHQKNLIWFNCVFSLSYKYQFMDV